MTVTRLRPRRDVQQQLGSEELAGFLRGLDPARLPPGLQDRLVATVERNIAAQRGWNFVMIDPALFDEVMVYLHKHSKRPRTAMLLWTRLFRHLPYDSNEVQVDRAHLAESLEVEPRVISEIMGELEAVGAVYRRREGARVRYFVSPKFGTHLSGAARDRAQGEAPPLRLVREPDPAA